MLKRAETEMPPTTGALESMHGHLNEDTGRFNDFWPSMRRLKDQGEQSMKSWSVRVGRNLNAAYRRCEGQLKWLGEQVRDQIAFYGSSYRGCGCGQTEHLSRMFGTSVPCVHQLACRREIGEGACRPRLDERPKLEWQEYALDGFTIDCEVRPRGSVVDPNDPVTFLKNRAVEQIRRFSKAKKKTIVPWVQQHFPRDLGDQFALGIPLKVRDLVLEGVRSFTARV
jgi:hypothetical protein